MTSPKETFVNKYVVHSTSQMSWKTYRIVATHADLNALAQAVTLALEASDKPEQKDEYGTVYRSIWSEYATDAYSRTARTRFEIAVAEDLAPYHERGKKEQRKDLATMLVLAGGVILLFIGLATVGYFALRVVDWLMFSHHRV